MGAVYYPKWFDVLCRVEELEDEGRRQNYLERLKRKIDMASSHLKKCLNTLEELGLIARESKKNRRYIHLTEQGREMAHYIRRILLMRGGEKTVPLYEEIPKEWG